MTLPPDSPFYLADPTRANFGRRHPAAALRLAQYQQQQRAAAAAAALAPPGPVPAPAQAQAPAGPLQPGPIVTQESVALRGAALAAAAPSADPAACPSGWAPSPPSLEEGLGARLAEMAICPEDVRAAQACLGELAQTTAARLGPGWRVRPFGSISNGFGTHGSDLDATCCRDEAAAGGRLPDSQVMLENMVMALQEHPQFQIVEEVKAARIPILRLKFQHYAAQVLDVDLSFQNTEPLPNTQLLRAYSALCPRVRDLGILVKLWAKEAGVCGAQHGHLSAYALTLMVIYFLQVEPSVGLPVLPTEAFGGEPGIPSVARFGLTCGLSRAELLCRFFRFFTEEFRWGSEVVSVRLGRRAAATDGAFSELRGRFSRRIHVEDPFLPGRNLHCALKQEQENDLFAKLWEASQAVQQGCLPVGLRPSPPPAAAAPTLTTAPAQAPAPAAHGATSVATVRGVAQGPVQHAKGVTEAWPQQPSNAACPSKAAAAAAGALPRGRWPTAVSASGRGSGDSDLESDSTRASAQAADSSGESSPLSSEVETWQRTRAPTQRSQAWKAGGPRRKEPDNAKCSGPFSAPAPEQVPPTVLVGRWSL